MKVTIANDLPKEMLDIINNLDLRAIPESQHNEKLNQLKSVIDKYVPTRSTKPKPMEIDVVGGSQKAANLISMYDWNKISKMSRTIAKPIIVQYLKNNKLWRS